jgi:hypothetical protein
LGTSTTGRKDGEAGQEEQSRFGFLITPVLFVSFLISLILVDRRTRASVHPPSTPCGSRCDREDFYHTRQRRLAKMEIGQAFQMRDNALKLLGFSLGAGILGTAGAGGWWLWKRGSS